MEVDPDEVKRHLEILGYTDIEPDILNEFVKDLKKLIEYDRKHNNVNIFSTSLNNNEQDQSYSARMKSSTPFNNVTDGSPIIVSSRKHDIPLKKNRINQNCSLQNCTKTTNQLKQHNNTYRNKNTTLKSTPPKCYFCENIQTESQPARLKVNRNVHSNPSHTMCSIGATFYIELCNTKDK